MTIQVHPRQTAYVFAWIALGIGLAAMALTLLFASSPYLEHPGFYFSSALIGGGCGELMNHPRRSRLGFDINEPESTRSWFRERNPCALGNVLIISSILLIFVGLGKLFAR